jgi:hypothetical protein
MPLQARGDEYEDTALRPADPVASVDMFAEPLFAPENDSGSSVRYLASNRGVFGMGMRFEKASLCFNDVVLSPQSDKSTTETWK